MKTLLIACLFAMLGGGLVAGTLLATAPAPGADEVSAASPARPDEDESLRGDLAALAERMDTLSMTLVSLQARVAELGEGPGTRVAADAVRQEEIDELRGLLSAVRNPETGSEQLEGLVLNVLEAKETRERAERDERRREVQAERMDERIAELTEKLGLNGYQAGEMKRILTSEQTSREEFFTEMREGGSWDRTAIRDGMEKIRTEVRSSAQAVLSASQYDQYVEQDSGFGFGGFGRRGGDQTDGSSGGGNSGGERRGN